MAKSRGFPVIAQISKNFTTKFDYFENRIKNENFARFQVLTEIAQNWMFFKTNAKNRKINSFCQTWLFWQKLCGIYREMTHQNLSGQNVPKNAEEKQLKSDILTKVTVEGMTGSAL